MVGHSGRGKSIRFFRLQKYCARERQIIRRRSMNDVSVEWRKRVRDIENVSAEDEEYGMEDTRAGHRKCVGERWGI